MMKKFLISLILLLICSCQSTESENSIAIVIHGGAGTILKENMTPELESAYLNKLEEAVQTGYEILKNGGSSQSAVEETIKIMEDSPLFNAGIGAALTNQETAYTGISVRIWYLVSLLQKNQIEILRRR